jgi:hypothetical protein
MDGIKLDVGSASGAGSLLLVTAAAILVILSCGFMIWQ